MKYNDQGYKGKGTKLNEIPEITFETQDVMNGVWAHGSNLDDLPLSCFL